MSYQEIESEVFTANSVDLFDPSISIVNYPDQAVGLGEIDVDYSDE